MLWLTFLLSNDLMGCNNVICQFACNYYFFLDNAERTFDRKKKNNGMFSDFFAVINLTVGII